MEATLSHLVIFLSLLVVLLSPRSAFADDSLSKGANITDGKTLVSADGAFIMGFFSPGASTKRYLGIWFSGSGSTDAVVWVANRERPISDKAGALVVSDTGSLVVLDGSMQVAWSSNSTSTSPVEAQLLNSGNLVVRNRGSATILWQSFDYPSNAMVAGMKVGEAFWNRFEWHLTSWRSPDDPAPGAFRRVLDTSGLPDNVVWKGSSKKFRTGPWNGLWFSGIPEVLSYKNLIDYQMLISSREVTYGYTVKPGAPFTYVVLTENGDVNRLVWDNSTGWQTPYHGPRDVCDNYGKCGAFGMCDASAASTGFCSCLKGFSPASPSEWKVREASGGCQRNVRLDCGKQQPTTTDGFELVRGVKLPDTHNASVDMSITVEECRTRCLANCSCVAYAAADIRGGRGGSGCIMWTENLIDLRYVDGGQDLYLRLARSEFGKPNWKLIAVLASVSAVAFISLLIFVYPIWTGRVDWRDIICRYPPLDLVTIQMATRNFSTANKIGEGAFGIVYKGNLPGLRCLGLCERTIAVKKLKPGASLSDPIVSYFTREGDVMGNHLRRHPNVLRFIANCGDGTERILVYEYMRRGSLDRYIFGERASLSWQKRLKIIKGIARGINHMSSAKVIHRDLKPENVLLDRRWNAKVADFGTVRLLVGAAVTGTRIGTPGYIAPEYVQDQAHTTLNYDVYSFGVTLLETLSGQRNIVGLNSLISQALTLWSSGNSLELLDGEVGERLSDTSRLPRKLRRCIQIGLLCVQEVPSRRPSMSQIVRMLSNTNLELAPPVPTPSGAGGGVLPLLEEADTSSPRAYEAVNEINLCWRVDNNREVVGNEHEIELMLRPE